WNSGDTSEGWVLSRDSHLLCQVLGTAAVIFLVVLYWNRRLRAEVVRHRRTAAALRESEEKYRRLFELSDDPMSIIQAGRFAAVNRATCRLLGYDSAESLLNTHPSEVSPEFQPNGEPSSAGRKNDNKGAS
ncbi:MAG: PAS domain S-box protein, partial [Candidatus Electrothrix sp. AUS1_2]|nr:PAS domain S-box protein [Candidatus Electrothrix sp. AUS1_2]